MFFQTSPLITAAAAEQICTHFYRIQLRKHDYFLREGKISNEYMILEEGFVRAYAVDTQGADVTTGFYGSMQPVFEAASFFNRTPSKENLQALTNAHGWAITFEDLNHLFHTIPEFREFGRSILVKGFTALKSRMLTMITETAEHRYQTLLETSPEIFQVAPLKHIASYLGVTDTSLSRIRKELMTGRN